jgi:nitrous oxidase accessory protein NosD
VPAVTTLLVLALAFEAGAATLFVRNDGMDAPVCGKSTQPCRSIGAALRSAIDGDRVVVGPGRYGDLNGNGTADPGDETYDNACSCLINVDKRVTLESEEGAAATIIDAGGSTSMIIVASADGAVIGKPGRGFTVSRGGIGIVTNYVRDALIAGNHARNNAFGGFVISGRGVRVTRNVATANGNYGFAIYGTGDGVAVHDNVASGNPIGFDVQGDHSSIMGNLATANSEAGFGINFGPHIVMGNSAIANDGVGIWVQVLYDTSLAKNNFYGNDPVNNCGLRNTTRGPVDARDNFWGAPGEPGDDPADRACDEGTSSTNTAPAATRAFGMNVANVR